MLKHLRIFAKMRKDCITFVMSSHVMSCHVCLSVSSYVRPHGTPRLALEEV